MLKKVGALYQKKDKHGGIYLVGKTFELVEEGQYLYVFKNTKDRSSEKSADFYACVQIPENRE
jgi:hypothetical protein